MKSKYPLLSSLLSFYTEYLGLLKRCRLRFQSGDLVFDLTLKARNHDSRTIPELRRRNAQFLEVEPLDESTCTAIIEVMCVFSLTLKPNSRHKCVALTKV